MGEAPALKTFYSERVVRELASDLARCGIDTAGFVEDCLDGLDALELTDRARHIGRAMRARLPAAPAEALDRLVQTLGPPHPTDELLGAGMEPFRYLPHVQLIAELGPAAPEAGLRACYEVTKRFTAEFCLRAILDAAPELTWAAIDRWVVDPDPHVRRLVSEGLRPRLPWAPRLRSLVADPTPAIARLDQLVDDPAELVRRSVANHLGDIAKDHPDRAVAVATGWLAADPARRRWVEYGLRHLVKTGHPGALAALGFAAPAVRVEALVVPLRVTLGDTLVYSLTLASTGHEAQTLVVEAAVTFPKARGTSTKAFRAWKGELVAGEQRPVSGRVNLRPLSTRTQFPGTHTLAVVVNGVPLAQATFEVDPA
ncbi:MAG: DNA alkylation repair protein [Myxococcota bacterium]